jgi:hypothetical protein
MIGIINKSASRLVGSIRALADLGEGVHRSGHVAERVGRSTHQLAPVRDTLIRKDMIYSPAYGDIAFTVSLFGQFMKRTMPAKGMRGHR